MGTLAERKRGWRERDSRSKFEVDVESFEEEVEMPLALVLPCRKVRCIWQPGSKSALHSGMRCHLPMHASLSRSRWPERAILAADLEGNVLDVIPSKSKTCTDTPITHSIASRLGPELKAFMPKGEPAVCAPESYSHHNQILQHTWFPPRRCGSKRKRKHTCSRSWLLRSATIARRVCLCSCSGPGACVPELHVMNAISLSSSSWSCQTRKEHRRRRRKERKEKGGTVSILLLLLCLECRRLTRHEGNRR